MKKRILLALFAVVMAVTMLATSVSAASMDDIKDADTFPKWAAEQIAYVVENDLMSHTGSGNFDHKVVVTRAQMAQMLYNLESAVYGTPEVAEENPFNDVAEGKWFTTAIKWAAQNGIVTGQSEGVFNPTGNINRGAMAVMLYRYAQHIGALDILDITRVDDSLTPVEMFYEDMMGDWKSTQYFYDAVIFAGNTCLMTGSASDDPDYPQFNVNGTATRAEAAIVLTRLHQFMSIKTLDAEIALAEFDDTYNSCAHPGTVYMIYGGNSHGGGQSSELNFSATQNCDNIFDLLKSGVNYDEDKWEFVIDGDWQHTVMEEFRGNEGGSSEQFTFALQLKEDPTVRLERDIHLCFIQVNLCYYPRNIYYQNRECGLLPSSWHCHERRGNYTAEVQAYLDEAAAEWKAEYVKDGKLTLRLNAESMDDLWDLNAIQRALSYSYTVLDPVNHHIDVAVLIHGLMGGKNGFTEQWATKTVDEDGDVDFTPTEKTNKLFADYNANGKVTFEETVTIAYASYSEWIEDYVRFFETRENWPHVDIPVTVEIVKDTTIAPPTHTDYIVQRVTAIEDITTEALGDFYCPECNAITVVAGQCWSWFEAWYNSGNDTDHWVGVDNPTVADFLLKMLKLHATAHMDSSKYVITKVEMTDEAMAAVKGAWGSHGSFATAPAKIWVAKVGDTANAVAFDVNINSTFNNHIAGPDLDWVDGSDENDNGGWDIVTGFNNTKYNGFKTKMGHHFGKCPHTDPRVASGTMIDNIMAPYFCEIHNCIHINTHNEGDLSDNYIRTSRDTLLGLFCARQRGDGTWSTEYNEGLLKITNLSDTIGEGKLPVNDEGIIEPKIIIGFKSFYDTDYDYRIYNVRLTCDTANPNTGVVPAMATLYNVGTGETKKLCASTKEYSDFLKECDAAEEAELDKQLAAYLTAEGGTIYYNPQHVFGHWAPGFVSQTLLENTDLTDNVLRRMGGNDAARFNNEVDFTGVFTHKDNGQWTWAEDMSGNKVEDGATSGSGKFKITVYLATTGRAVTRELTATWIGAWLIDGSQTTAPDKTHAQFEAAAEKKLNDAIAEATKAGALTIHYNCSAPANESWTFGEVVGNAIAAHCGLVLDPNNRYNLPNYATNDYHVVRLQKEGDSWTYDPAELPNGWDVADGTKACENTKITFEWLLPRAYGTQKSIFIDINVTLVRDNSLASNTAVVK